MRDGVRGGTSRSSLRDLGSRPRGRARCTRLRARSSCVARRGWHPPPMVAHSAAFATPQAAQLGTARSLRTSVLCRSTLTDARRDYLRKAASFSPRLVAACAREPREAVGSAAELTKPRTRMRSPETVDEKEKKGKGKSRSPGDPEPDEEVRERRRAAVAVRGTAVGGEVVPVAAPHHPIGSRRGARRVVLGAA